MIIRGEQAPSRTITVKIAKRWSDRIEKGAVQKFQGMQWRHLRVEWEAGQDHHAIDLERELGRQADPSRRPIGKLAARSGRGCERPPPIDYHEQDS
jgi:hypothetical protein